MRTSEIENVKPMRFAPKPTVESHQVARAKLLGKNISGKNTLKVDRAFNLLRDQFIVDVHRRTFYETNANTIAKQQSIDHFKLEAPQRLPAAKVQQIISTIEKNKSLAIVRACYAVLAQNGASPFQKVLPHAYMDIHGFTKSLFSKDNDARWFFGLQDGFIGGLAVYNHVEGHHVEGDYAFHNPLESKPELILSRGLVVVSVKEGRGVLSFEMKKEESYKGNQIFQKAADMKNVELMLLFTDDNAHQKELKKLIQFYAEDYQEDSPADNVVSITLAYDIAKLGRMLGSERGEGPTDAYNKLITYYPKTDLNKVAEKLKGLQNDSAL